MWLSTMLLTNVSPPWKQLGLDHNVDIKFMLKLHAFLDSSFNCSSLDYLLDPLRWILGRYTSIWLHILPRYHHMPSLIIDPPDQSLRVRTPLMTLNPHTDNFGSVHTHCWSSPRSPLVPVA
ncbi:hypothetical protein Bca4012_026426 [Brassica carinata]